MAPYTFLNNVKIDLLHVDKCSVSTEWNYPNIISPFTRIYFVTEGTAKIILSDKTIKLEPGYLYLIPSYTHCSYICDDAFEMFYLHFTNELSRGLKIFDLYKYNIKVLSTTLDLALLNRLLEINPNKQLRNTNPEIYQKPLWSEQKQEYTNQCNVLETQGIILQLLSRHVSTLEPNTEEILKYSQFKKIFSFINCHLSSEIQISELAQLACYSEDHFSRLFKKTTGLLPIDYINKKRVEKAQLMMMTTDKSLGQIQHDCGFNSLSYFYRTFKKNTDTTPSAYRHLHIES